MCIPPPPLHVCTGDVRASPVLWKVSCVEGQLKDGGDGWSEVLNTLLQDKVRNVVWATGFIWFNFL